MAFFIDEERFIDDSVSLLDERLNSPIARFIEQTPTFVTYYHINTDESTSDAGFNDVDAVIGSTSPIKYQRVDKFPIYGLDQIIAQLQDTDTGIDTSYEGEASILPNTLKPLPNDYFIIPYVGNNILFRITAIEYDNIRQDNFYKISFKLDAIDTDKKNNLEKQVYDKYTCVLENIGTENKCIIQNEYKEQLDKIDKMYNDMVHLFISIFYDERYNCILGELANGYRLYDPFMTSFINKHKLFMKKNSLETMYLEEDHVADNKKQLKYERSIFRFFERRDIEYIKPFFYTMISGKSKKESAFSKWDDESIQVVDIPSIFDHENTQRILPDITIETIRLNGPTESKYLKLITKFLRKEKPVTIYDIELDLNEELIQLDANLEMFFITPLLLYIIKEAIVEFNKTGMTEEK